VRELNGLIVHKGVPEWTVILSTFD
jgi:hypothetical protein